MSSEQEAPQLAEDAIKRIPEDLDQARRDCRLLYALLETVRAERDRLRFDCEDLRAERDRLRAWIARIDAINDSPAHFNTEIDDAIGRAMCGEPVSGFLSVLSWDQPAQKPAQRERSAPHHVILCDCDACKKWRAGE